MFLVYTLFYYNQPMGKSSKLLLGILTFLPLIFVIIYLFVFFSFFIQIGNTHGNHSEEMVFEKFFGNFIALFALVLIATIINIGLMIYYIIHSQKNPGNDTTKKLIWILILVFASTIGCVVYYFVEILPESKSKDDALLKNY